MTRRSQEMRYESRIPANEPAAPPKSDGERSLGMIEGTIGWRVAYSLLQGIDSIRSIGTLPWRGAGVDLQLILGHETSLGIRRTEGRLGMAHLTYRGLLRQIRGMLRVALPQTRTAGFNGRSFLSPPGYRYSAALGIRMFFRVSETRLRPSRGMTPGVNA